MKRVQAYGVALALALGLSAGQVHAERGGQPSRGAPPETLPEPSTPTAPSSDDVRTQPAVTEAPRAPAVNASDPAYASALRLGTGIALGASLALPRLYLGEGASDRPGYAAALNARYVATRMLSVVGELGLVSVGFTNALSNQSGVMAMGGLEARLPFSEHASDQALLRGGLGYESLTVRGTKFQSSNVLLRLGGGYRRLVSPSLAVEVLGELSPALVLPEQGDARLNVLVGLSVGVVVGL